jgi:hypothetical protein
MAVTEKKKRFLRLANTEDTKRYFYEVDGEMTDEYIDLRTQLTKQEASDLLKFAPRKEDDLEGGLRFIEAAFHKVVSGWSLTDEDDDGKEIALAPSVEVYQMLDASAAAWIDRSVGAHLRGLLGADAEAAEGKQES